MRLVSAARGAKGSPRAADGPLGLQWRFRWNDQSTKAPLGEVAQPLEVHASQQLAKVPTHEVPFFGGLHRSALDFVEHFVVPLAAVLQQVTNPGLPHVDLAAHLTTTPLQLLFTSVLPA